MQPQNSTIRGVLVGLISPLIVAFVAYIFFELIAQAGYMDPIGGDMSHSRWRTIGILGICGNMFWINRWNTRTTRLLLQGVLYVTMVYALLWFVWYTMS